VRGAYAAFLLEAIELCAGTFALMWISMLIFRAIDRGHFRATTWVLAPLMLAVSLGLPGRGKLFGGVAAGLMALFLAAVYSQRPLLEFVAGPAAAAGAIWTIVYASGEACQGSCGLEVAHALTGAFFLGAVSHAMILGHWYLNQPRLPIEPLKGATAIIFGSLIATMVAGVVTRSELLRATIKSNLFAVSATGFWWVWLLLVAGTAVLALMIRSTVWIRSTQSATGLLYIAMIPALGAQFLVNLLISS
jgi:hypothetical protein